MTPIERQKVAAAIFKCAAYYGKEMSQDQVRMFLDITIEQFKAPAEKICEAFTAYMSEPKNKFFPAPVHLRQYIDPEVSTEDVSAIFVADLATAVRRHGYEWPNGYINHTVDRYWRSKGNKLHPTWEAAVRAELGDIGVEVVRQYTLRGLCDLFYSGNLIGFNSQVKQYVTATQNVLKSGNVRNLYALKEPDRKHVLNSEVRNGIQVFTKPTSDEEPL